MTIKRAGGVVSIELFRTDVAGNRVEDLSPTFVSGSVSYREDLGGGVPMTFDMTLIKGPRLSPLEDFVSPYLTIRYDDGTQLGPVRLGVFLVTQPKVSVTQRTSTQVYTCEDLTAVARDAVFTATWKIPTGTNIASAITAILQDAGLVNVAMPDSTKVTGYNRAYPKGMTNLEAANKLCVAAGWWNVYSDVHGVIRTQPMRLLTNSTAALTITDDDYINTIEHTPTQGQVGNVVVVRRERSDQPTLYAIRKNTDVDSPISIPNVGREILYTGAPIDAEDAEDQSDVDTLADRLIEEARSYERVVSLTIPPDMALIGKQHQVAMLDIKTDDGFDFYGRYWVREWSCGLSAKDAPLKLTLARLVRLGRGEDVSQ